MGPRKKSKQKHPQTPAEGSSSQQRGAAASIKAAADPSASSVSLPARFDGASIASSAGGGATEGSTLGESTPGNNKTDEGRDDTKSVRRSWYGGSWKSKALPVAQVAKESIGVARGATSELSTEDKQPRPEPERSPSASSSPAQYLAGSRRRSSKGTPIAASMTKLNVTSDGGSVRKSRLGQEVSSNDTHMDIDPPLPPNPASVSTQDGQYDVKGPPNGDAETTTQESQGPPGITSRWIGWWSRPDPKPKDSTSTAVSEDAQQMPLPGVSPVDDCSGNKKTLEDALESSNSTGGANGSSKTAADDSDKPGQSRSWFWFWSTAQNSQSSPDLTTRSMEESRKVDEHPPSDQPPNRKPGSDQDLSQSNQGPSKSSGWAFWSRDKPADESNRQSTTQKHVGELAVADTPSQSCPEAAQFNEQETPLKEEDRPRKGRLSRIKDAGKLSTSAKSTPSQSPAPKPDPKPDSKLETGTSDAKQLAKSPLSPPGPPNLVLPSFTQTYSSQKPKTYWQALRQYLLGEGTPYPHLSINSSPPRIRKAVAIGVHGYFPASIVQRVLGPPTGTSIRFANAAATAIKAWARSHGQPECHVDTIALEGEGVVRDRVDTLWKLLLNWIEEIRHADFILVACHSQGVPVAIMLLARLVQFECVSPGTRIGVCAMAGVNLGPFVEYRSRFLDRSAAELFDFARPGSTVTQLYEDALQEVLKAGVRILYVGSIDDQLVSLESSTFATISHPYIYRAVFIDGRIHAPDFITHLVSLTLKLRNIGVRDHGLIRELSPALAGSLYSGEGHSRIYEEEECYRLAVQHTLETISLSSSMPFTASSSRATLSRADSKAGSSSGKGDDTVGSAAPPGSNPYFLPWAMRGVLEEEKVRKELGEEVQNLLRLFEAWRPSSKPLKDVRFRLEAVRSKL